MEREKNTLLQKACHWMAAVIISLFVLPPVHAQRQTQTINDSWKFLKGECTAAADSGTTTVSQPRFLTVGSVSEYVDQQRGGLLDIAE